MNTPVKSSRPHLSGDEVMWAYVTGGGLLLVILAVGSKAATAATASETLNILEALGFFFTVVGALGWSLEFRPWRNFDDLTTPLYTGGHAHADHSADSHPVADHDNPGDSHTESVAAAHESPAEAAHH